MKLTRKSLAVKLSKIIGFRQSDIGLEQYMTDSEIAADVLWHAYQKGDIQDKTVADFGAGTGILGIGALLLGAKKVFFVEMDEPTIAILKENLEGFENHIILCANVNDFFQDVDTILQNPPFGTKTKHADRAFIMKAITVAKVVYSFHKTTTTEYIRNLVNQYDFETTMQMDFSFPIKKSMPQHKKKVVKIEVSCLRFEHK